MVPDPLTLIALLGGVDRLAAVYHLRAGDDIDTLRAAFHAAMASAGIEAPLDVLCIALQHLRIALLPPPGLADFYEAGWALVRDPEPGDDRVLAKGGEEPGAGANLLLSQARDPLAAVVALARGIDPHGSYRPVRARRAA